MTTEIAILNKSAVALATDSAATVTRQGVSGERTTKIFLDANKLFELIKGVPVGVMIYNGAEVAGLPWESLVKVYRSRNRLTRFDTISEYVSDFLEFVKDEISRTVSTSTTAELEMDVFAGIYSQLYAEMKPTMMAESSKVKRRKILEDSLERVHQHFSKQAIATWANGLTDEQVYRATGKELVDAIPGATDELTLPIALRRKFAKVLITILLRHPHRTGAWSGVVISGFGESEMLPSVFHCRIAGFVQGRLIAVDSSCESISATKPSIIQPYAQTGEALVFLQGIDPQVSNAISSFWETWSHDIQNNFDAIVKQEVPSLTASESKRIRTAIRSYMKVSWDGFSDYMNDEFHRRRMEPIEASAGFLSKREIADLAESLVEFTSLRNRVSLDRQETVGGATDVAVISKGDGFVWVKRKHYFEQEKNPNWGLQQAVADVVAKLDTVSGMQGGSS